MVRAMWGKSLPRLLLVEDDPLILRAFPTLLSAYAQVECVRSAAEALAHAGRERVDIAIVDREMHGESALELLEQLAATQPRALRVLMTGASLDPVPPVVQRLLRKPVELDDVLVAIRS